MSLTKSSAPLLLVMGMTFLVTAGLVSADGAQDDPVESPPTPSEGGIEEGVAGRITDSEMQPIEGAFVQAESLDDPRQPIPELAVTSDEDGRYEWPLFPGRYRIAVSADGYRSAKKTVEVETGEVTELHFMLERL